MNSNKGHKSIKKKLLHGFFWFLLVLFYIPASIIFLSNQPLFQTFTARLATNILSDYTNYRFNINSINIGFVSGIEAGELALYDHHNNIMIKVGKLKLNPFFLDLKSTGIVAKSIELDSLDFRLGTYQGEDKLNLVIFINELSDTSATSPRNAFKLKIKHLALNNSRFQLFNYNDTLGNGKAMDYSNMKYDNITLLINDFHLVDDSLNFHIQKLSADEKSGLQVKNLQTDFVLSGTTIRGEHLVGTLNHSFLNADIELNYKTWNQLNSFLDSVQLKGNFRKTKLDLSDIGFFADAMFPMKDNVEFSGQVSGTVEDFSTRNFIIDYGEKTHIDGDFTFSKIVEYKETQISANIRNFTTNLCDIRKFKLSNGDQLSLPKNYVCDDSLIVKGTFEGNYFDFTSNLDLMVNDAPLQTALKFKYNEGDTVHFFADLTGDKLNLGHISGLYKYMGNGNLRGTIVGNGNSFDDLTVDANIHLNKIHLLDYTYDSINFKGKYQLDSVQGLLSVIDKNLMLKINGGVGFASIPSYKAHASIAKANFKKLNLLKDNFSLATNATFSIKGDDPNKLIATLNLDSTLMKFGDSSYFVNSIKVKKYKMMHVNHITLQSDYLNGRVSGKFKLLNLGDDFMGLLNNYMEISDNNYTNSDSVNYIRMDFILKNDKLFKEQFLHGFTMEDSTHLFADVNFKTNKADIKFSSPFMAIDNVRFKNNNLSIKSIDDKLALNFNAEHVILKDTTDNDNERVGFDSLAINASAIENILDFNLEWKNSDTTHKDMGFVKGYFYKKDKQSQLTFDNVKVYIADTLWTIDKNNSIVFNNAGTYFKNVNIKGGSSSLSIQGQVPKVNGDSLLVRFNNWNLSNFDALTKESGINFDGFINGSFQMNMMNDKPTIVSDVTINGFGLNNVMLGDARIMNTWDNINQSLFIKSFIVKKGNVGRATIFSLDGFYYPFNEENSLQLKADFNRINIALLNPFLKDLFHGIEGKGKGSLDISGTLSQPVISGKAEVDRASLIVNYLNTRYSFSNSLEFKKNEINFDNIVVYDTLGNSGIISGNLQHNYFNDFKYDIKVKTDKLLFINTDRKMNELYYGIALVSGTVHLWGGPGDIHLNADAKTVKGTDLNIPLDYVYDVSDNDYIEFVPPPVDSSLLTEKPNVVSKEEQLEISNKEKPLAYNINLKTKVTPVAKVNIFLPSEMGNIKAQGKGDLALKADSKGTFSMIGDYIIKKGYFNFTFKNLVSKQFDLIEGGKISWSGDPTGAILNIKGLYKVKTNVSSLGIVIDSTASYKNKLDVYCYITLTNKLLNPTIKFSIDIPDADPDLKRMIFASLDTTNASVVNEQIISLLVLGTFSYSNASNVSLASSGYSILSNQLSSILSKMSDKVDIGVNYKPGDAVSQEEFEVALSTQLFNDRLSINGNFGMTYDRSQGNASNIIGDVDILYKLTKDGRWLLKAYNHSNVNSWYYYNNYDKISPYTQGVGVAYKKEFNNISELFKNNRSKKNKNKL